MHFVQDVPRTCVLNHFFLDDCAANCSKIVPNLGKSLKHFVLNAPASSAFCLEKSTNVVKRTTFDLHFLISTWVSTRTSTSIENWASLAVYPLFTHKLVWCPFFCVSPGAFLPISRSAHGCLLFCFPPHGFWFEGGGSENGCKSPMRLNL